MARKKRVQEAELHTFVRQYRRGHWFETAEHLMADNQFWRYATGRLAFSMGRASADSYRLMCDAIAATFVLVPHAGLVTNGYDIVFQDYRRNGQIVGLEWDNWMGYTIVAKTADSESLVEEIGDWLLGSAWAAEG